MESIIRGAAVFLFILLVIRLSGKRTLSEATTFDFVLLLVISETIQEALIGHDRSLTNSFLLVLTIVGINVGLSFIKPRFQSLERWIDGLPVIVVQDGQILEEPTKNCGSMKQTFSKLLATATASSDWNRSSMQSSNVTVR